jgi:predicted ribosomally synthesized peptide with nif11-like leader
MSVQSANGFLQKFKSDPAFKKSIEGARSDDERKQLVKKAGFDFTKAELKAAAMQQGKQELNEEELESVAGGSSAAWGSVAAGAGGAAAAAA